MATRVITKPQFKALAHAARLHFEMLACKEGLLPKNERTILALAEAVETSWVTDWQVRGE